MTISAEQIIQKQLNAYNSRNLEELLRTYSEDAELFEHPSRLLAKGNTELRLRFTARFTEPDLHAELLNRIVMSNIVIDHERVTRNFPEGKGTLELVMIYEVAGEQISKAWSIPGKKTLL